MQPDLFPVDERDEHAEDDRSAERNGKHDRRREELEGFEGAIDADIARESGENAVK